MKKTAIITLFTVFAVHVLLFFLPPFRLDVYLTLLRPTLYAVLALIFAVLFSRHERHFLSSYSTTFICILGGVLLAGALFLLGFAFGFAHNSASSTFDVLIKNTWMFIIMAVVREYLRGKIVLGLGNSVFVTLAITLIFSFCFIDSIKAVLGYSLVPFLNFSLDTLLPILMLNFFLTYAARTDGGVGNMVFMGIYQSIYYASPGLPNIPKILDAMAICLCVFVIYILLDGTQWRETDSGERYPWVRLALTTGFGALAIMFVLGVFRYFPLVVISNSMKGTFSRGDVVIIRKIDLTQAETALEVGDVIEFKSEGGIPVVHRIVEVQGNQNRHIYKTKGDNNPTEDDAPVMPEQIVGTATWFVPYVGYPTLLLTMR